MISFFFFLAKSYFMDPAPEQLMENYAFEVVAGDLVTTKISHPLPYSTGDLFCLPNDFMTSTGLSNQLIGEQISSTVYKFHMHKTSKCKLICKKRYTPEQKKLLYYLIDNHYKVNYYIDSMPAYVDISTTEGVSQPIYGVDIGFKEPPNSPHNLTANAHYITTHYNISIHLFKDFALGINYIMGVTFTPISPPNYPPCVFDFPDTVENTTEFFWTYSLTYDYVDEKPSDRWRLVVQNSYTQPIKWALIVNIIIGCILASFIFYIFFLQYIRQQSASAPSTEGWKVLRNDVFRPPKNPLIWSSIIAYGIHIILVCLSVLIPCALHILSPAKTTNLAIFAIISYIVFSFVQGYILQYIFASTGATSKKFTVLKGNLYIHAFNVCLLAFMDMTMASWPLTTHFITVNKFFLIFTTAMICIFLACLGSILCMVIHRFKGIADCSAYPRQIRTRGFWKEQFLLLGVGFAVSLPFVPICDLCMRLSWVPYAIWKLWPSLFGCLIASYLISIASSMASTFYRLKNEDYEWWWPSIIGPLTSIIFVFMRCLLSVFVKMDNSSVMATISYIVRIFYSCAALGASCAAISGFTALFFVIYAYKNH